MQKLSIIAKDYHTTEYVRGFLTWQDTAKAGAAGGGHWGSFVGSLFGTCRQSLPKCDRQP